MTLSYLYSKFFKRIVRGKSVKNSAIDKTSVVNSGCNVINVKMGKYSYLGYDCEVFNAEIGSYCSIAGGVYIGGDEHPINWVSTSPVFHDVRCDPAKRFYKHKLPPVKQTIIGNDVWIGRGAIVKQGVKIGNCAIIGSGAVVTKDVEPYSIIGGCPAKLIRYRFSDEVISELEKLQWWNLPDEVMYQLGVYATDVNEFIAVAKQYK